MERYRRISFILMFTLVIFTVLFAFTKNSDESADTMPDTDISASQVKNSRRSQSNTDAASDSSGKETYLLILEENKLCAYSVTNGVRKPIEQAIVELSLMNDKELNMLKTGLYADTYEDLCLYFESYTS